MIDIFVLCLILAIGGYVNYFVFEQYKWARTVAMTTMVTCAWIAWMMVPIILLCD